MALVADTALNHRSLTHWSHSWSLDIWFTIKFKVPLIIIVLILVLLCHAYTVYHIILCIMYHASSCTVLLQSLSLTISYVMGPLYRQLPHQAGELMEWAARWRLQTIVSGDSARGHVMFPATSEVMDTNKRQRKGKQRQSSTIPFRSQADAVLEMLNVLGPAVHHLDHSPQVPKSGADPYVCDVYIPFF